MHCSTAALHPPLHQHSGPNVAPKKEKGGRGAPGARGKIAARSSPSPQVYSFEFRVWGKGFTPCTPGMPFRPNFPGDPRMPASPGGPFLPVGPSTPGAPICRG